jgi:hypothetical protein
MLRRIRAPQATGQYAVYCAKISWTRFRTGSRAARAERAPSTEHRGGATAPWERGRLARWRPLRVPDSRTPASRLQRPHPNLDPGDGRSPPGRRSAGVSPALQRTAGAAATRVRRLAAHGSAAVAPWSAGVAPAFQRTAPGSRRSRACRERRRRVAARRHAAEPVSAEAARHDDRATRRRPGGAAAAGLTRRRARRPRSQGFHHGRLSTTVFTIQ